MIQTCTADYRTGAGRPDLEHCGRVFDDAERSTICPHAELGQPVLIGEPEVVVRKTAVISSDGLYRYELTRTWCDPAIRTRPLTFVMLNPSTADASVDDPTIRRCVGFARRDGLDGIRVVNLYAWRTSSPDALFAAERIDGHDIIGPENGEALRRALRYAVATCTPVVAAWGGRARPHEAKAFALLAANHEVQLHALKVTQAGQPGHPLYVRGDAPLVPWESR